MAFPVHFRPFCNTHFSFLGSWLSTSYLSSTLLLNSDYRHISEHPYFTFLLSFSNFQKIKYGFISSMYSKLISYLFGRTESACRLYSGRYSSCLISKLLKMNNRLWYIESFPLKIEAFCSAKLGWWEGVELGYLTI